MIYWQLFFIILINTITAHLPLSPTYLYTPYYCTHYHRLTSHLSTKTPYDFRHTIYHYDACDSNTVKTTPKQTGKPCIGSSCPLQLQSFSESLYPEKSQNIPQKKCKLIHINHLTRHGSRAPTNYNTTDHFHSILTTAMNLFGINPTFNITAPLSWLNETDSAHFDPIFDNYNAQSINTPGRLELHGMGMRMRQFLALTSPSRSPHQSTNRNIPRLHASTTFKHRTVESLASFFTGLQLYNIIEDIDIPNISLDNNVNQLNIRYQTLYLPHFDDDLSYFTATYQNPPDALTSFSTSYTPQSQPNDTNDNDDAITININRSLLNKNDTLAVIMEYERQFIHKIVHKYNLLPSSGRPREAFIITLKLKVSTQNRAEKISNNITSSDHNATASFYYYEVSIPQEESIFSSYLDDHGTSWSDERLSPLIMLYYKHFPEARPQAIHHRCPDPNAEIFIPPYKRVTKEYAILNRNLTYYNEHYAYQRSFRVAPSRFYDECDYYNNSTTSNPHKWLTFMDNYYIASFGVNSLADIVIHTLFTHKYIEQYIFSPPLTSLLHNALIEYQKLCNCDILDTLTSFVHDKWSSSSNSKSIITALLTIMSTPPHPEASVDDIRRFIVNYHFKENNIGQKQLSYIDSSDLTAILSFLYRITSKLADSETKDAFYRVQLSRAKSRYKLVKVIYDLCSFQLETYSHLFENIEENNNNFLKNPKDSQYLNQFCTILGTDETSFKIHFDFIQRYKSHEFSPTIDRLKNNTLDGNIHLNPTSRNILPIGVYYDSLYDPFINYTLYYERLVHDINKKLQATNLHTIIAPTNQQKLSTKPLNFLYNPIGSHLFYHFEYISDIQQIAKKGSHYNITFSSSCVGLDTLLSYPPFPASMSHVHDNTGNLVETTQPKISESHNSTKTGPVTISLLFAHAETLLPILSLITDSYSQDNPDVLQSSTCDQYFEPELIRPNLTYFEQDFVSKRNTYHSIYGFNTVEGKSNINQTEIASSSHPNHFFESLYNFTKANQNPNSINHVSRISKIPGSLFNYPNNGMYSYNSGYRNSQHCPMGANLSIQLYECDDKNDMIPRSNSENSTNIYAQLLLNEEMIKFPLNHDNIHQGMVEIFPTPENSVDTSTNNDQHFIILPYLARLDDLRQFFKQKYVSLGMNQCNIKDFFDACYVQDYARGSSDDLNCDSN